MKADQFSQALENIDDRYLQEAEHYEKPARRRIPWRAVAAVMAAVLVLGCVVFTAEAAEYRQAVAFFQEHHLSLEGLTRSEIKQVYQDITTNRFTYEKTAEVLVSTVSGQIEGYEIAGENHTAAQLQEIWDLWDAWAMIREQEEMIGPGIVYDFESIYTVDDPDLNSTTIQKYADGILQWEKRLGRFNAEALVAGDDHICVYDGFGENGYSKFSVLDAQGNILFIEYIVPGPHNENIRDVLVTEESVIIFTIIDLEYLGFYEYDLTGNCLSYTKTYIGRNGIRNPIELSDGYLVRVFDTMEGEYASLIKLDKDGNHIATTTYESNDYTYHIQDMVEYAGRIYLSAYQIPLKTGAHNNGWELHGIFPQILALDGSPNPDANALTALVREYYDAVLLVCTPDSEEVTTYYTVDGALGAELRIREDGVLVWEVEEISTTYLSIATNSFTIGGVSQVYEYHFDEAGSYLGHEDTGTLTYFRR